MLSDRKIYRLAASGQMPAAKVGGRWRFHADALDRWLISMSEGNLVQNNPNKRQQTITVPESKGG